MTKKILIIILLFFFISCQTDNSVFFIFDRADGLTEKSKILQNGYVIGHVDKISIHKDYRILVKCKFKDKTDIPFDSVVRIKTTDLFGTKSIYITSGTSNKKFSINDTIVGLFENRNLVDTILIKGSEIINDVIDDTQTKIDTLANELKKTNGLLDKEK